LCTFKYSYHDIQAEPNDTRQAEDCHLANNVIDNIQAMVIKELIYSEILRYTNIQAFKVAVMEKKLLQSKDPEDQNGKNNLDKIKSRSVNTSELLGNAGSELNPWKEQRIKAVPKTKETFQLSLFNRFSY
jgi:hypothetical protein